MKKTIILSILCLMALMGLAQSVNTYEYDAMNRLTKTTYVNGATVQYTYDALGRRLRKQVNGVTGNYTIAASVNPNNSGTVTGAGTYSSGSTCTLTATPNTGFSFVNWTENSEAVSSDATYSFTVTGNRTLVANFVSNLGNYYVAVSANPSGGGSVAGDGYYQQGSICTVTATANSGYSFINWTESGQMVSASATYNFTVTGDRSLVANFENNNPVNPVDGLVAYYPFDGDANDYSGNGNHGSINGSGLQPTTDRFGNENGAYLFGGYYNRGWIQVPNSSSLVFNNAMSMSFWMNMTDYGGMNGWGNYAEDGFFALVCKKGDRSGFNTCVNKHNDEQIMIHSFNNNNSYDVVAYPNYLPGQWMHCVVTIEDDLSKIYINGVLQQESITIQVDFSNANNNDMYIGIMNAGGYWYPYNGKLDELRIYNRALTAQEVSSLYGSGSNPNHEYVDLGLPSGTLWATCNIGANTPEESGDYFAWGETQPKDSYNWSTYQYCNGSNNTLTKYCDNSDYGYNGFTDDLTILLPEDDAATANWGEDWRVPTKEEYEELCNNTTVTWVNQNGVNGRLFTASNGNAIFLPAAGCRWDGELSSVGSVGNYWSSSLHTGYPYGAWYFCFDSDYYYMGSYDRGEGRSVRAVRSSPQNLSYGISATANPAEGGTVSGAGTYQAGAECTLTATASTGYTFVNWTENGQVVSSSATYSFTVTGDRTLVANFQIQEDVIVFADPNVKAICVANWDTNGSGELSYAEAAAVTSLGSVFRSTAITSFEELQYFTGLTSIGDYAFYDCTSLTGNLYIPSQVTSIGERAFSDCSGLTGSLTIPNSVTSIGNWAFAECAGFTGSLVIPNSVTSIGEAAFIRCGGFTGSLTIPNSVTSIGNWAFCYCSGLTGSLTIPNSVTSIGAYAFRDCSGFTGSLTISNSVTLIGEAVFYGCSGFTGSLSIPNSVTMIGNQAFYNCSGFTGSLAISNSVTSIGRDAFLNCSGFTGSLTIPNSVTSIGEHAFFDCSGFTGSLTIFDSVTSIGYGAFRDCSGFTSMTVMPETPPALGEYAFLGVSKTIPVSVSCGSLEAYQTASGWNEFDNYQGIDCPNYEIAVTVNPSNGGTVSGAGTYQQGQTCTLTATSNYEYAFINWTENGQEVSTSATYSFTVTGDRNLVANFELQEDVIVFADPNVKAICVANWDTNGSGELSYAEAAAVTDLGQVFKGNTTITSFEELQYFTGLTSIRDQAFYHCSNLTAIAIPISLNSMGIEAFSYCSNLDRITVSLGNTRYDSRNDCNAVVETATNAIIVGCNTTVIPNTITSIGSSSFRGSRLTTLEIPNSVISIGFAAFYACSDLVLIMMLSETPPIVGQFAFDFVPKTIPVSVPCGSLEAYQTAAGWNEFTNYQGLDCPSFEIAATANPSAGGTVSGAGSYQQWETCTLTASPNNEYAFINWTENGQMVSSSATYSFTVTGDRNLVANFELQEDVIVFADPNVKAVCVANWDTNGSGELSYEEAAAVTDLGQVFSGNTTITSFEELQYFTGLNSIGDGEFYYCQNLSAIVLPNTVTSLGSDAMGNCASLTSITIPSSVTSFSFRVFLGCIGLEQMVVDGNNPLFDSRGNCNAIIETASNTLIFGCKNTVIPNSITGIGPHAFNGCSTLNSIVIPNNVTFISYGAFASCSGLTSVALSNSLTYIGQWAFMDCYSLTSVEIPSLVTYMADQSFGYCNNLQSITILAETPPGMGNEVFVDVSANIPVFIPCGLLEAYQTAEGWNVFTNYQELDCPNFEITATANPTEGGTVSGAGSYQQWETCTLTATPNNDYVFINWTENGVEVSTEATYSFTVTGDRTLVANFEVNVNYHWDVNVYQYADNMSMCGIIQIDGVEQATDALELGAFSGDECRGRDMLAYSPVANRFIVFLTVYGEEGDGITFRLYDHQAEQEIDLPCSTSIAFSVNAMVGSPFDPYIFNFTDPSVEQTTNLQLGWNWYSTFIEINDIDGLAMLEEQLGENSESINSQTSFTKYYENYGWYGSLTSVNNESMYRLKMINPTTITMTGMKADPLAHPITVSKGWNHIGYISPAALDVNSAFVGLEATPGDIVKNQSRYAQYYDGYGWYGSLTSAGIINPGDGLMYKSVANEDKTFTYPANPAMGGQMDVITESKHWTNDAHAYPSNMTMLAVVELDGVELNSNDYEIAAFAEDGCRGSIRLQYVEPMQRYVAFLTITGDDAKELRFALYNKLTDETAFYADEQVAYTADAMMGTFDEPFVLHFRQTTGVDETKVDALVYPNPTDSKVTVEALAMRHVTVTNAMGQVLYNADVNGNMLSLDFGQYQSGIYLIHINTEIGCVARRVVVAR